MPVCLEVVKNAVSCAHCHKILCEVHGTELKECPHCRAEPFKTVMEFGLRCVMEDLSFPCKFCKSPIRKGDLNVHEANCPKRPRHCGAGGCQFASGDMEEALRHFIQSHGQVFWENFTEATAAGMANKACSRFAEKSLRRMPFRRIPLHRNVITQNAIIQL